MASVDLECGRDAAPLSGRGAQAFGGEGGWWLAVGCLVKVDGERVDAGGVGDEVEGTDSCQVEHVGYCLSGSIHVTHDDGSEGEVTSGEVYRIAPGHDAWVVGDEPMVAVEFQGAASYAKPS